MTGSFQNAFRRIQRAKRKIGQIEDGVNDLIKQGVVSLVVEPHLVDGRAGKAAKVKAIKPIPDELSDLVDTTIDGLRSALDFACYGSAVELGAVEPKSAYFPFADDQGQLENTIKGRCKNLHPEIIDLLRAFKPYHDGNKVLWAFNKVRQGNQHKMLVDLYMRPGKITLDTINISAADAESISMIGKWFAEEREFIIIEWIGELQIHINEIQVVTFPVFTNAGILNGEPVVGGLKEFAGIAERIVSAIKAETERIRRG